MLFPARFAQAADGSWNVNADGSWTAAGSWTGGTIPGSNSTTTSTDIATFGLPLTAGRTVTVDANRNIAGITLSNNSAFAYQLNSGSLLLSNGGTIQTAAANGNHSDWINTSIYIQGNGGSASFIADATSSSSSITIGSGTIAGVSTAGNTTTLTLSGNNTTTNKIGASLQNGANGGTLAVVKNGSGTWVIGGSYGAYSGGTTLNSGTIISNTSFGPGALSVNGGTLILRASNAPASSSFNGTITLLSDNTSLGAGASWSLGTATIANGAVVNVGVGSNVNIGTASVALSAMNTAGNATFNIQNTVVGNTTVTGRLYLGGASTLGAGTATVTGSGQLYANNGLSGAGGLTLDSNFTGQVILKGYTSYSGATVINGGTLQAGDGTATTPLPTAAVITNNGTLIFNTINGSQSLTNGITGTGNVVLNGGGTSAQTNTVTLSGTNTYTGNTTISFGTLNFNNAGRLENSAIILSGSAVSVLNVGTMVGTTPTIKSLSGVAGSSVTLGSKTLLVGDATSTTYAGVISGAGGGLTKQGNGTMTLSGNNTYTGATTVSAGTLQFAATQALYGGTTASWTAANIRAGSGTTLAFNVGGTGEFTTGNVTSLLTNLAASSSSTNGTNAGAILGFDTTNASGGNFAIADVIADTTGASGGARALAKLGTGTLALSGNNTYSGSTTTCCQQ